MDVKSSISTHSGVGDEVTITDMLQDIPGVTDTSAPNQGARIGPTTVLDGLGRVPNPTKP